MANEFLKGNAVVGQSGGPTAAINATLAGVIRGFFKYGQGHTLYGMRNGVEGLSRLHIGYENGALPSEPLGKPRECQMLWGFHNSELWSTKLWGKSEAFRSMAKCSI